jgi:hypothetical protein
MLQTYLQQLEAKARAAEVRLLDAYLEAGLADSNYYRHRGGHHEVSEKLATRIFAAIQRLEHRRNRERMRQPETCGSS